MTRVAVFHDAGEVDGARYRAVGGGNVASGRTAGEALDALAALLPAGARDTLVIVRNMAPDAYFDDEQRRRLDALMAARRAAAEGVGSFSADEEAELEQLVDAELRASAARARDLLDDLTR